MPLLYQDEAQARSALIEVTSYDVQLDLTGPGETFTSTSTVTFAAREPGTETFADVVALDLSEATLNGRRLDPPVDGRLRLGDLARTNVLRVSGTFAYSRDGQGLHRSVDPADGQVYIYGMSFLDAAPQVFACFDQPDLKAPFDVRVSAPDDWVVAGNGHAEQVAPGDWVLATTPPLATYFVTVCAGPYATVEREHDGIALAVHARASMAQQLREQADDILRVTERSFDYYHQLFGIRYPWGDYHQFFVPEFNAGAMENPGCVVFRDQYIFRGHPTRGELLSRASVIAHEMAHQWFGNLVTMRWWDDLWLNESFAEYMGYRTTAAVNEFPDAWARMGIERKTWGYAEDRGPGTHPVAGSAAGDNYTALTNFDGISYSKGASVLRQLVAWLGDEAFLAGVRAHLSAHRFGNATLADFLAAMQQASGQDVNTWAGAWLRTTGADVLSVGSAAGVPTLICTPPGDPAGRRHVVEVGAFAGGQEVQRFPLVVDATITPLPDLLVGRAVVVPNVSDETWAQVDLDEHSLQVLPQELASIPDLDARQVIWSSLIEGVARVVLDPRRALEVFEASWPDEPSDVIAGPVGVKAAFVFAGDFLPYEERPAAIASVAEAAMRRLAGLDDGDPAAISTARLLAATTRDHELLQSWARGESLPAVLADDRDIRWSALHRLAALGLADEDAIAQLRRSDPTLTGALAAVAAGAAIPTADAKQRAWSALVGAHLSNYEAARVAGSFFDVSAPGSLELLRPYVDRFFTEVPRLSHAYGEFALSSIVSAGFPLSITEPHTAEQAQVALDDGDLTASARRQILQGLALLRDALRSHERFASK
ncbi:aminopeptidase N [Branchiibius hedensis]|uniref:Aminopeptidase N n=1 Tax=Branchiibius hedensis TaxID=672460 RepID=A0A2Y9C0N8_9MICO|nr:aminopeptidase N [Branchiibius hedensis]PWJ24115.1 aminopeptidase N [Branchiibius hedensis]SSA32933.1 aminopeptidase N [Branchiibius hedensis]